MSRANSLPLQCPRCRVRLRIKQVYAHLRGRCPSCGYRIEALVPKPFQPTPPDRDTLDLQPIEEEWPEPAQVEGEDSGGSYEMAPIPDHWGDAPPPAPPAAQAYPLGGDWQPTSSVEAAAPAESYRVDVAPSVPERSEVPAVYHLSQAELNPLRAPPPAQHPLWQGVYGFPWHRTCLRTWFLLTLGACTIVALAMFMLVLVALAESRNPAAALAPIMAVGAVLLGLWTGGYAASAFLAVIQDTAAGNHDVHWTDDGVGERSLKFLFLLWLGSCAALPVFAASRLAALPPALAALSLGLSLVTVFPLLLLSSLAAGSPWRLLNHQLLGQMGRNLQAVGGVLVVSCFLAALSAGLAYLNIFRLEYFLTPLTGMSWAACLLIYARVLGRLGWLLARSEMAPTRRKKL